VYKRQEFLRIDDLIKRISLSRFEVSFRLSHNGKIIRNTVGSEDKSTQIQRINQLCGQDFVSNSIEIDQQRGGLRIYGWVAKPNWNRAQADRQFFYINGRMIKDKLVGHAIRQAYQDVLFHGRFPAFVLYLDIDPKLVDVNVHPTKHEVRFMDSRLVHDFIFGSIHQSLAETRATHAETVQQAGRTSLPDYSAMQSGIRFNQAAGAAGQAFGKAPETQLKEDTSAYYQALSQAADQITVPEQSLADADAAEIPPLGYAKAQIHGVFILAENQHGLIVVDMHAAHERITYERMKQKFADQALKNQKLLVPINVNVSTREVAVVEEQTAWFEKLGFEVAVSGDESIVIRKIPALLAQADVESLIKDVLSEIVALGSSCLLYTSPSPRD